MIELGMHTDNWRTLCGNFPTAVESAVKYSLSYIEFGVIHGQYFVQGLGYDPTVSLQSNPRALKRYLDQNGLKVSQIDSAYPLMGPDGSSLGVPYVRQAIRFAAEIGCPYVDTTDGAMKTPGFLLSKGEPTCPPSSWHPWSPPSWAAMSKLARFSIACMPSLAGTGALEEPPLCPPFARGE